MIAYLMREAKKKAEYPLSPQHNQVTAVDIEEVQYRDRIKKILSGVFWMIEWIVTRFFCFT